MIKDEPLLRNMAVLYFLIFFLLLNQDFQFYRILRQTFINVAGTGKELATRLSSFLGMFRGISTSITLMLQVTIAGFFLRRMGTAKSMYLMPAAFTIIFGTLFLQSTFRWLPDGAIGPKSSVFYYSLFSIVIAGVGVRIATFDSIFSPNFQIFFSSLPKEVRGRGKLFIEGVVKPLAISLAGLFMIVIANHVSRKIVFIFLTLVSVVLLVLTSWLKRRYTDSIARYLGGLRAKRLSSILNIDSTQAGESLLSVLSETIHSEDDDLRSFAIETLRRLNTEESVAILVEEFHKGDAKIKAKIIESLSKSKRIELLEIFRNGLVAEEDRIVANSIEAIAKLGISEADELIRPYVFYPNNRVCANALVAVWPNANSTEKEKFWKILRKMISSESDLNMASALYAMGEIGEEPFFPIFQDIFPNFLQHDPMVFNQWVKALGKIRSMKTMDLLIQSLAIARRKDHTLIQRCLADNAVHFQKEFLHYLDRDDWNIRQGILGIVQRTQLKTESAVLRKVQNIGMEIASDTHRLLEITRNYLLREKEEVLTFLATALQEEWIERAKECLILVASILDPSDKIFLVSKKLRHPDPHIRANAIEMLENVGDPSMSRLIIPLFEKGKTKLSALPTGKVWNEYPRDFHSFLQQTMNLRVKWIRAVCIFVCYKFYILKNDSSYLKLIGLGENLASDAIKPKLAEVL